MLKDALFNLFLAPILTQLHSTSLHTSSMKMRKGFAYRVESAMRWYCILTCYDMLEVWERVVIGKCAVCTSAWTMSN